MTDGMGIRQERVISDGTDRGKQDGKRSLLAEV